MGTPFEYLAEALHCKMFVAVQIELLKAGAFPGYYAAGVVSKLVIAVSVPRQIENSQVGQVMEHELQIRIHQYTSIQIEFHQTLARADCLHKRSAAFCSGQTNSQVRKA